MKKLSESTSSLLLDKQLTAFLEPRRSCSAASAFRRPCCFHLLRHGERQRQCAVLWCGRTVLLSQGECGGFYLFSVLWEKRETRPEQADPLHRFLTLETGRSCCRCSRYFKPRGDVHIVCLIMQTCGHLGGFILKRNKNDRIVSLLERVIISWKRFQAEATVCFKDVTP